MPAACSLEIIHNDTGNSGAWAEQGTVKRLNQETAVPCSHLPFVWGRTANLLKPSIPYLHMLALCSFLLFTKLITNIRKKRWILWVKLGGPETHPDPGSLESGRRSGWRWGVLGGSLKNTRSCNYTHSKMSLLGAYSRWPDALYRTLGVAHGVCRHRNRCVGRMLGTLDLLSL